MPGRILVIDDDRQSRRIFESHLTVTSFAMVGDKERILEAGADDI